jgi:HEAT repeats
MSDWRNFFYHFPENQETGTYRIFEPQGKLDALQWFKREDVAKEQKEEFIAALISINDGCGDFYRYQAYFLASEAIAHFTECSLADGIIAQLLKWSYAYFRQDRQDWQIYPDKLARQARLALEATDRERVITAFESIIHTTESRTVLRLAAERLGKLDPGNKHAIAAVVLLMQETQDKSTLSRLICILLEIGSDREIAIAVLVNSLQQLPDDAYVDGAYVSNLFYYLQNIGAGSQAAIACLVNLIETTPNQDLCRKAIETLGIIGNNNCDAIDALTRFVHQNRDDYVHYEAAMTLCQLDPDNLIAINYLIDILETEGNDFWIPHRRVDAATYLVQLDSGNNTIVDAAIPKAIATLVNFIESPKFDVSIFHEKLHALEKIGKNNETVKAALLQVINTSQDERTCLFVAESLLQIDPSNCTAFAALYRLLDTMQNEWMRYNVAKTLLEIVPDDEKALAAFSQILQSTKHQWMCLNIAPTLLQNSNYCQLAIDTLCRLIYTQDFEQDNSALSVLESIDPSQQLAINALIQLTNNTWEQDALIFAAQNLARLAPGNTIAQEKLNHLIGELLNSIQNYDSNDGNSLLNVGIYWRGIEKSDLIPHFVSALKTYLSDWCYNHTPFNYDLAYGLIWDCAARISYLDFYKAWYQEQTKLTNEL